MQGWQSVTIDEDQQQQQQQQRWSTALVSELDSRRRPCS